MKEKERKGQKREQMEKAYAGRMKLEEERREGSSSWKDRFATQIRKSAQEKKRSNAEDSQMRGIEGRNGRRGVEGRNGRRGVERRNGR